MNYNIFGRQIEFRLDAPEVRQMEVVFGEEGGALWVATASLVPGNDPVGLWRAHVPKELFPKSVNEKNLVEVSANGRPLFELVLDGQAWSACIDGVKDGCLCGWFVPLVSNRANNIDDLKLLIDGRHVPIEFRRTYRRDFVHLSLRGGMDGFSIQLPSAVFNGIPHSISLQYAGSDISGGPIQYSPVWKGNLEIVGDSKISGWIFDLASLEGDLSLGLYSNNRLIAVTQTNVDRSDVSAEFSRGGGAGFEFDIGTFRDVADAKLLSERKGRETLRIAPLFASEFTLFGAENFLLLHDQIEIVRKISASLDEITGGSSVEKEWFRRKFIPSSLLNLRNINQNYYVREPENKHEKTTSIPMLAVVVPVYDGFQETMECLNSLAMSSLPPRTLVLVIEDASPNAEIRRQVPMICDKNGFLFVRNPHNYGFVNTVNWALRSLAGRDVIILNSDTVVPSGFADRLRAAAESEPRIASVTPMSNNATIVSFPHMNYENALMGGLSVDQIDQLFQSTGPIERFEIPTGIGFCMYMRREAINAVGVFDQDWGKGYCEENDWCLRARDHGFKNIATTDTFVGHEGGISFGEAKVGFLKRNIAVLQKRYPEFSIDVESFIDRDPFNAKRRKIANKLLFIKGSGFVLFVTHSSGGGISRNINDHSDIIMRGGIGSILLWRKKGYLSVYRIEDRSGNFGYEFNMDEAELVLSELIECGLIAIHVQTIVGLDAELAAIIAKLQVAKFVTLHDFAAICPRVTLTDAQNRYCGQPSVESCEVCVATGGVHELTIGFSDEPLGSVGAWRKKWYEILLSFDRVFAPSYDAASRLRRDMPALNVEVLENTNHAGLYRLPPLSSNGRPWRVVIPGAIGLHKGYAVLLGMVRDATRRSLPLEFVVAGYTCDDALLKAAGPVEIVGAFQAKDAVDIIRGVSADIALLCSIWPETYSYILTEAWQSGLRVIAYDIGAPADRIRRLGGNAGWLISLELSPSQINDRIVKILAESSNWEFEVFEEDVTTAEHIAELYHSDRSDRHLDPNQM